MDKDKGGNSNNGCMITYSEDGYKKTVVTYAIKLGVHKVILLNKHNPSVDLLDSFGLSADVKPVSTSDINSIISSALNIISDAKKNHDDVNVLLIPSSPIIIIGIYIAACIEKAKILIQMPDFEKEYLALPFFPFVNLNENERFILTKIGENGECSKKALFKIIKKEARCDMLRSKNSATASKEESLLKNLQRTLNRLEETGLVNKKRGGRHFVWSSTSFGKLVFDHKKG